MKTLIRCLSPFLRCGEKKPHLLNATSYSCIVRAFSSASVSLESSDVELSYTVYPKDTETVDNKQTPLLFLHGLFGAKGNLHSVSKHLSSGGRKVVTYDARNHGNSGHIDKMDFPSMAQDLSDLIDQLEFKEPAVLGHSMGGKTAMVLALHKPDSMSSLIIADVTPSKSPGFSNLLGYAKAMKDTDIPQKNGIIKARHSVQVQLTPVIPDREVLAFLLTNLVEKENGQIQWRMNLDAIINSKETMGDFPNDEFQPFTKPTLFVFGADSSHYRNADQGRIKSLFPSVQIEAIPGAGHFVHAQKPIEFVNIIQQFLKSVESGK